MSGKFSKKTKNARARAAGRGGKKNTGLLIGLLILLAAAALAAVFLFLQSGDDPVDVPEQTDPISTLATLPQEETQKIQVEPVEDVSIQIGHDLELTDLGKYTGVYMEDGSDEIVSGVMMIVVTNRGEADIQYAKIQMTLEEAVVAEFVLSTLPAGESVVVLEANRAAYSEEFAYDQVTAENVAVFGEPLSLHEDTLRIQPVGGALNITNISALDIAGDIVIYYKNSASDLYYGGITYRVRITGGLKAGELRQIMPAHFSAEGSAILFVTIS